MDATEIGAVVRRHAEKHRLVIWESFPWGGATVLWPEAGDLETFLDVAHRVGARMIYVEDGGDVVGFAADGVVHGFATPAKRKQLVEEPSQDGAWVESDGADYDDDDQLGSSRDFSNPYFDYRSNRIIGGELRELVDRIVADEAYDGYRSKHVVADYARDLSVDDFETVRDVAGRVFRETVARDLDARAQRLVPGLAADAAFDPLSWGSDLDEFVRSRLVGEDPRVISRAKHDLLYYARERGLYGKAEQEVSRLAERLLEALPPLARDQFGFASKNVTRAQVAGPYLGEIPDIRRPYVLRELAAREAQQFASTREARYATAVRKLLELGITKADIARRLGISTSVMERIVSTHRSDVDLEPGDPLVTTLAPEVGQVWR